MKTYKLISKMGEVVEVKSISCEVNKNCFEFVRLNDGMPLIFGMYPIYNWTLIDVI